MKTDTEEILTQAGWTRDQRDRFAYLGVELSKAMDAAYKDWIAQNESMIGPLRKSLKQETVRDHLEEILFHTALLFTTASMGAFMYHHLGVSLDQFQSIVRQTLGNMIDEMIERGLLELKENEGALH